MTRLLFCLNLAVAGLFFCSCHQQKQSGNGLFISVPADDSHIFFSNTLEPNPALGILQYIYYYNGAGVAVGDVNNDGLPDIYFSANSHGHNRLYLNKGHFFFEDVTEKAGVAGTADWCTGVTMADVNGDGYNDIYVCAVAQAHGLKGANMLFVNNRDGTFTDSAKAYGLDFSGYSTQAAFFDYDHDGNTDCYLLNQSDHPNQHIVDTSHRRETDKLAGDCLFHNVLSAGKRKFENVSAAAGIYQSGLGYGLGLGVADLNNDGWEDIYIGNDFHENDYYYVNNGNGTFTESGASHFRHYSRYSMGNDIADINNDGQLDLISLDMLPGEEKTVKTYGNGEHLDVYTQKITRNGFQNQFSRNCLQLNNGDAVSFSETALMSGVSATDWSWSPLFADFDNDGKKDLFISSGIWKRPLDLDFINFFSNIRDPAAYGSPAAFEDALLAKMPDGAGRPAFFKGNGDMNFTDVSAAWGTGEMNGYFNGAAYGDFDADGRLDMVVSCLNGPALLLKNAAPLKHHLTVSMDVSGSAAAAAGAKVFIYTPAGMQYQQLMPTRGFMSASEPALFFGLNNDSTLDSLRIIWPDKHTQLLTSLKSDQRLILQYKNALMPADSDPFSQMRKRSLLTDVSSAAGIKFVHRENDFNDFASQPLLPHMESTRGPHIAVGDINRDGLDDFFICGAKGQAGVMFRQGSDGKFIATGDAVFQEISKTDQVDALFADVNKDGYPDLLVLSGGNELADGNPLLSDHLYLNDAKGHFTEASGALPSLLTNKSVAASADVNRDGYPDIFIASLCNAKQFGVPEPSWLLLNDGHGRFRVAPDSVFSIKDSGMITSAVFADLNNDGWPELAVAGEWMSLQIFQNKKGHLTAEIIPNSSGLWQSLYSDDVNGDGYPDLLAGNWGLNAKWKATKGEPLKMYCRDFNGNGGMQQIITYSHNGVEYPFLGKDQLERTIPYLKKAHLSYDEVAGRSVGFLFGDRWQRARAVSAETLSSAFFVNDKKGKFNRVDLPERLQLAPLYAFTSLPSGKGRAYLGAGNLYGVLPYEGRYDAQNPSAFTLAGSDSRYLGQLPDVDGEVRDMKWLRCAAGNRELLLARNNRPLMVLAATSDTSRLPY